MEEFYKVFNIAKVEHLVPGRDWDANGLASWYSEYEYPYPTGDQLFALIDILIEHSGPYYFNNVIEQHNITADVLPKLVNLFNELDKETAEILREEVRDVFEDGLE